MNATQAAVGAGYSGKTAYSVGQRLLKNVEAQAAIRAARQKRARHTKTAQDWMPEELRKLPQPMAQCSKWPPRNGHKRPHLSAC
ncbi:MAG: terminase small subunit [Bacillota bacterium]